MMLKLCMQNNDSRAAHENTKLHAVPENTDSRAAHKFFTRMLLTSVQHMNYGSHLANV